MKTPVSPGARWGQHRNRLTALRLGRNPKAPPFPENKPSLFSSSPWRTKVSKSERGRVELLETKSEANLIPVKDTVEGLDDTPHFVQGVMITLGNIVATAAAVMTVVPNLGIKDIYMAYLPLAHVFELAAETVMMTVGASIGYSTTLTLTDTSSKIKKGTQGDATVLKPTLMASVPAILDRVKDEVIKKVEEKGGYVKFVHCSFIKGRVPFFLEHI